jgi:sucrose-6-phosphate hydrolase SacC (GH32 family)
MREYGQIQCAFWQSQDAQQWTDAGKLLAAYLMTGPHSNGLGCYRCPDGYVMADLGWTQERVSEGFAELSRRGFAYRFEGVVFIPGFLRWNKVANGNVAAARMAEFEALPKGEAKARVAGAILNYVKHLGNDYRTVLQTVAETVTETVPPTVTQTEPNPTQPRENPNQTTCAAPAKPAPAADLLPPEPASPVAVSFLLNDGKDFDITEAQVREFADLYPAIDVLQQLRAMKAWTIANPKNRKTRSGAMRFVNSWLSRAQNQAPTRPGSNSAPQKGALPRLSA